VLVLLAEFSEFEKMAYTLEETPTWAVAAVCTLIVLVSLIVERLINLVGKVRENIRK
jgi:hypothetical protein